MLHSPRQSLRCNWVGHVPEPSSRCNDGQLTQHSSASQGLGQQILAAFCLSGGHGAVVDLSLGSASKSIETINAEVKEKGLPEANLRPYECNTADEAAVKKTWAQVSKDFGKVDVLCTNAGITGGVAAEDYDFNDWKGMLDVNVNGTFLFAKEAGQYMIKQGIKGSIIMVSSMSGVIVNRPQKQSAYNTVSFLPVISLLLLITNRSPSQKQQWSR